MIVDALKTRLNRTCFFVGYDGMPVTWMEAKPDALLKIIVYYRPGKVRGTFFDIQLYRWSI
jgi:hypothetical protein